MRIQATFKNQQPTLYLIGTPIGNLEDMSHRAITILQTVDYILCEDTRTSQKLLHKYNIKKPLISLHKFNEADRITQVQALLSQHHNLAMISDAGCPVISDPGAYLIQQLLKFQAFNITSVNVGPAYIHALIISGFLQPHNYFHGFLKHKTANAKHQEIKNMLAQYAGCLISFYESVHRIIDTILVLKQLLPIETNVLIARELTKLNEEIIQGTIEEVSDYLQSPTFIAKGEFVIVIDHHYQDAPEYSHAQIISMVKAHLNNKIKLSQACEMVAQTTKLTKNQIYQLYVKDN